MNRRVLEILERNGIRITEVYYCPHNREDGCECIKPKPYFLREAAGRYGIDLSRSYVIGDHPHDVEFAENAGAKGIYVLTGHGGKHTAELKAEWPVAGNLLEAVEIICGTSESAVSTPREG